MQKPERNITSKEAAHYLGYKENTLRISRCTGVLAGKPAPKHYKLGRNVRYRYSDLDNWLEYVAVDPGDHQ